MKETELYEELYNLKHKDITLVLEENVIYVIPGKELKKSIMEDIFRISEKHGAGVMLTSYAGRFEIKF